ncbi:MULTISPECIES: hypothetical protein [Burkholderia]|nr:MULTISPECIES: hypothetical protein [Burkholderia]
MMTDVSDHADRTSDLTVSERVRAALLLFEGAGASQKLSVSRICRAAGVNRANLYANHRDLVEEILRSSLDASAAPDATHKKKRRQQSKILAARLKDVETKYHALMIVCIEQQAEISALRVRLSSSPPNSSPAARERSV